MKKSPGWFGGQPLASSTRSFAATLVDPCHAIDALCPVLFVAPVQYCDASGAASLALDYTNLGSPAALIQPGSVWNFQFLYRDPQPFGGGFNLSDGLHATFCP